MAKNMSSLGCSILLGRHYQMARDANTCVCQPHTGRNGRNMDRKWLSADGPRTHDAQFFELSPHLSNAPSAGVNLKVTSGMILEVRHGPNWKTALVRK